MDRVWASAVFIFSFLVAGSITGHVELMAFVVLSLIFVALILIIVVLIKGRREHYGLYDKPPSKIFNEGNDETIDDEEVH